MAEDPYAPISSSNFNSLSSDLVELILSFLPVPSLLRASAVCKHWYSLISSPIFPSDPKPAPHPWFFLYGLHNTSSRNHQSFAFDPQSNSWFSLPVHGSVFNDEDPSSSSSSSIASGSDGFLFSTTPSFSYTRLFRPSCRRVTSPLRFPRINPLLGVFRDDSRCLRFIVVGGVRFIGNLVDIEDRPAVEIYDPISDSWDLCPPLPADFSSGNSSLSLSSALLGNRLYVFGISSCFISSFDLRNRIWSGVQTLRPPGLVFSFLVACRNRLVLAGMCIGPAGPSFNLWEVDQRSMEFSEIAIMPPDLLNGLVDSEDDDKFESLKCVGLGDLIYVFNEEYHKKYPACVCEISGEHGKCQWRRLPDLPSPVNKFHKVISFCSVVSIQTVLLPGEF